MNQTSRLRWIYTATFVFWALLLLLEGREIGDSSATRDAAKAAYHAGAALVAAVAIVPWTLGNHRD
jgi:hypothetical protein